MRHKRALSLTWVPMLICMLLVGFGTFAQDAPPVEAATEMVAAVVDETAAAAEEAAEEVSEEDAAAAAARLVAEATPAMQSYADDVAAEKAGEVQSNLDTVWTLVAAILVFFMQAGFALVEGGLTRAKNVVNIIMKNVMDFSMASIGFFVIGYGLMFGKGGFVGASDFMLSGAAESPWTYTFFMFQLVFAGTAATIVSGAMAERTKFTSYLVYSGVVTCLIYPIFGHWAWGSLGGIDGSTGWLETMGFCDFAGSTVVHSIGGWLALAGAIVIGPRIGKYGPDGKPKAILGHNFPMAALGVFILWMGWFGFNPGSTVAGIPDIGYIAVTTNLSAAAGSISAMIAAWILFKKPDGSMTLNGALAGLVGITAGCASVSPWMAIVIGLIAGVLCVVSVVTLDTVLKIDDPVGAVSVHGVCGLWGTLACGLFNTDGGLFFGGGASQLITQVIGAAAAFGWAFGLGLVLFLGIKFTIGLRVTPEEEIRGLDIDEHGMEGYAGFQIYTTT